MVSSAFISAGRENSGKGPLAPPFSQPPFSVGFCCQIFFLGSRRDSRCGRREILGCRRVRVDVVRNRRTVATGRRTAGVGRLSPRSLGKQSAFISAAGKSFRINWAVELAVVVEALPAAHDWGVAFRWKRSVPPHNGHGPFQLSVPLFSLRNQRKPAPRASSEGFACRKGFRTLEVCHRKLPFVGAVQASRLSATRFLVARLPIRGVLFFAAYLSPMDGRGSRAWTECLCFEEDILWSVLQQEIYRPKACPMSTFRVLTARRVVRPRRLVA